MDDTYPSTDEQQSVHLEFEYPDVRTDLDRGMPIVKWFLAIPHNRVIGYAFVLVTDRYPPFRLGG